MNTNQNPEQVTRDQIDLMLEKSGWHVCNFDEVNIGAYTGIAIREFPLEKGHGRVDYLLYLNGRAAGIVEAKKVGDTLSGVEIQAKKYSEGLPATLPAHGRPLPFLYQSTGIETRFTNDYDPGHPGHSTTCLRAPEWTKSYCNLMLSTRALSVPALEIESFA